MVMGMLVVYQDPKGVLLLFELLFLERQASNFCQGLLTPQAGLCLAEQREKSSLCRRIQESY